MADKSTPLLLEALKRLAGEPAGLPLLGGKTALFPATAAGKEAARQGKEGGLLKVVRTEVRGKSTLEYCKITDQGFDFLLSQVHPGQVLTEFLQALAGRKDQLDELVAAAQLARTELQELRSSAEQVLARVKHPPARPAAASPDPEKVQEAIVTHLDLWQATEALDDCPLPELYDRVQRLAPLTIGQFHDALRQLLQQRRLYLHPWSGPLYALPQPQFALFVGHQIAYYASLQGTALAAPHLSGPRRAGSVSPPCSLSPSHAASAGIKPPVHPDHFRLPALNDGR